MFDQVYAQWLLRQTALVRQQAASAVDIYCTSTAQSDLLLSIATAISQPANGREDLCGFAASLAVAVSLAFKNELAPDDLSLCAALLLVETGIYTLDHLMDQETDAALSQLEAGAVLLGGCSMIGHVPASMILRIGDPSKAIVLLRMLSDGLARLAAGQLDDLRATTARQPSADAVRSIVDRKTGQRRALYAAMAAVSAGASEAQAQACSEFGRLLGIARQLRSDLQDLFGEGASRDLASGTVTLPIALALERSSGDDQAALREALSQRIEERGAQRAVRERVKQCGAMRAVVEEVQDSCARAFGLIDAIGPRAEVRPLLEGLVHATTIVPLEPGDMRPATAAA